MRNLVILFLLATASLHAQTVPYPEKYRYLLEDPRMSRLIFLRDTTNKVTPLSAWKQNHLDSLYDRIERIENNTPFPFTAPPPYPWSTTDLYSVYMTRVAQSLFVEANAMVPWSIRDLPDSLLASLFEFDLMYNSTHGGWAVGNIGVLNWDARRTYHFCVDSAIVQPSQRATVLAFTDWCRRHLQHYIGTSTPKTLYDYDGPVAPLDRILAGLSTEPGRPYTTFGCGGTEGIWTEVMRSLNIVVMPRWLIIGYPGSEIRRPHYSFSIPTVDMGVVHGDDFYTADVNFLSGGSQHYVPANELFITGQWWDDFEFSPKVIDCDGTNCNNPVQQALYNQSRRMVQLDVQYLTDHVLYLRSTDPDMSAAPTGLIAYFTRMDSYTFAHPILSPDEQTSALRQVDSLLCAIGGGSWITGASIVRNRMWDKPKLPGIALSTRKVPFGVTELGKPVSSAITITNFGSDSLLIRHIGSTNKHFAVSLDAVHLGPKQTKQDSIHFLADSIGYFSGHIRIESNDASSPDSILVEGRVRGTATLQLSLRKLRFGDVTVGRYRDTTVTLSNGGTDTLVVSSVLSSRPGFAWMQKTGTFAPGEAVIDTVRFRPSAAGPDSAYIFLASNDPGNVDTLWVYGNGLPGTGTGVGTEAQVPTVFSLDQNYPNPFNPSTTIRYGLPDRSHVRLTVYNTLGQQVSVLQNGDQDSGYHEVRFDGSGLSSGVYLYRLQAGSFTETRRFLLIR